jgi:hypothetical protein
MAKFIKRLTERAFGATPIASIQYKIITFDRHIQQNVPHNLIGKGT